MNGMKIILKLIICIHSLHFGGCTIAGITYMDPLIQRELPSDDDPCNPLYWYPRSLPARCYIKPPPIIMPDLPPIPMPIPVPFIPPPMMEPPEPLPFGVPPPPILVAPPLPFPLPPPPHPFPPPPPSHPFPLPPNPFPPPPNLFPSQLLPILPPPQFPPPYISNPFGFGQAGMVPGLPGLVTHDGGINILPFSDVYADVLEKYKQKKIRKRLEKNLGKYGGYRYRLRRYRNK